MKTFKVFLNEHEIELIIKALDDHEERELERDIIANNQDLVKAECSKIRMYLNQESSK